MRRKKGGPENFCLKKKKRDKIECQNRGPDVRNNIY